MSTMHTHTSSAGWPQTHSTGWSIFMGVLLLAAGLFSLGAPLFAGIAASVFFGWLLFLSGVAHLIYAWHERGAGAVLFQILIALVYSAVGIYMLLMPIAGVLALSLILAFYIALEGFFELATFALLRRLRGAAWFLADGLISLLIAALILIHWPSSSLWAVGLLVGVSLLLSGIARISWPIRVRAILTGH